jgi:transaldolase
LRAAARNFLSERSRSSAAIEIRGLRVKLFLDTANLDEIREGVRQGVLRGVTTNPSLIAKEDDDFLPLVKEICATVEGDVSIETASDDTEVLVRQGHEIAQIADNAVVKVALTHNGLAAVRQLSDDGIKVNVTLCFSAAQAILAAEAGAYIVSPFLGRLDDVGTDGLRLLSDICEIYAIQGYETQVLAASLRHPIHVVEAARIGADIATMPFKVFQALAKHPLTDAGFKKFSDDWEGAKPHLGELLPSMQEA